MIYLGNETTPREMAGIIVNDAMTRARSKWREDNQRWIDSSTGRERNEVSEWLAKLATAIRLLESGWSL